MALHRFLLRPLSAWGTPLRSDTLAGLLLYRLAEDKGEAALKAELDAFQSGQPPFTLSSAMPAGTVFSPKLPPARREVFARLVREGRFCKEDGSPLNTLFEALNMYKGFRKRPFLPLTVWEKHRSSLSAVELFSEYCRQPTLWKVPIPETVQNIAKLDKKLQNSLEKQGYASSLEMHVAISRQSSSAQQGGLFATHTFWAAPGTSFHLYAETDDCPELLARLRRIGQMGYGRDSSTGKGVFSIEEDTSFTPSMPDLPHGLLISMLSAGDLRGLAGWYATEVKTGKTGPAFCLGNPFKSPFLCVQEGAVLTAMPQGPFILRGIHADPAIIQITQPLTLPCRLAEEEGSHGR